MLPMRVLDLRVSFCSSLVMFPALAYLASSPDATGRFSFLTRAGIKRIFFTARSPITGLVTWTSQTVPSLLEDMLQGQFFATAMDRNFFLGREKESRAHLLLPKGGEGKGDGIGGSTAGGARKKARWGKEGSPVRGCEGLTG